jgi:hypothetical protein
MGSFEQKPGFRDAKQAMETWSPMESGEWEDEALLEKRFCKTGGNCKFCDGR